MIISIVIPAKGTSERLENKNLLKINGKSLVEMACEKVLKCKNINNVYLDTESQKVIECVDHLFYKGLKLIKRHNSLANNNINANDLMVHAMHSISYCDLLLQTFSTSPLIKPETIDKAIEIFLSSKGNDGFITVVKTNEYYWDKFGKPENFDINELPNSVNLPEKYIETHGLYGVFTKSLMLNKNRFGKKTLLVPIPKNESLDIDDSEDFALMEAIKKNEISK